MSKGKLFLSIQTFEVTFLSEDTRLIGLNLLTLLSTFFLDSNPGFRFIGLFINDAVREKFLEHLKKVNFNNKKKKMG